MIRILLSLLLIVFLFIPACKKDQQSEKQAPEPSASDSSGHEHELVVVATNDFHAALQHAEGMASVIRGLRKKFGNRMV